MANIVPDSFKTGLLKGTFNFDTAGNSGNAFKLALYTSISSYSASSTTFLSGTGNGEVSSTGTAYPAGGKALTNNGVNVSSNIAFIDFAELTFNSVTLTAAGAAIYKTTGGGNELVMVLDFGGNKTATNGDFVVQFPANNSTSAILRIGNA